MKKCTGSEMVLVLKKTGRKVSEPTVIGLHEWENPLLCNNMG